MSESNGQLKCNICQREFNKYNSKESNQVFGISLARSKTYSVVLDFVKYDKSEINRHICTYCIADIINKFE